MRPQDAHVLRRAVLASPITALRNLNQWQFPMVAEDCTVIAKGVGIFRVRSWSDDLFHALPKQEPAVERVVRARLKSGDVFVDAGANIGYYTILASKLVGSEGAVIAVEMMPDTAAILRENVALNDSTNVRVVEAALSDLAGEVLAASAPPGKFGQARLGDSRSGSQAYVATTTLCDILDQVSEVTLMKLDVEGGEVRALQGARDALRRVKAIIFETLGGEADASHFLKESGFRIHNLDGRNKLAILESS